MRAHQIMTKPVITIAPETTIVEAAAIMLTRHISGLPVLDEVIAALGPQAAAAAPAQSAHVVSCGAEEAAAVLAQIRGMVPAVNVFLELGRPTNSFGQPPMMMFRLIDILHHTRLENIEQVMECLEFINEALAQVRQDGSAKFCGFDSEGHCFVTPETQASIAKLWQSLLASRRDGTREEAVA